MQFNKVINFFLVTSLLVMILLTVGSLVDLTEKNTELKMKVSELELAKRENDQLGRLLDVEIDKNNKLMDELTRPEDYILISRTLINVYDITKPSGISIADFNELLKGTGLQGLGASFYEAEHTYEINGFFAISVAQLESGYGTTPLAKKKNNLFAMNAWGDTDAEVFHRAVKYSTKHDSIMAFGKLMRNNYINKGRTNVRAVGAIYCELPTYWTKSITRLIETNIRKMKELGDNN